MRLIVDLIDSGPWLQSSAKWPAWLDKSWLAENQARIVCRLSHPDDLTDLRALVPDPDRLLAYPSYPGLDEHLGDHDKTKVHQTFLNCLGAQLYFALTPRTVNATPPEPTIVSEAYRQDSPGKSRLALVSPMPPTASGIATYCAELLAALDEYYTVTLVVKDRDQIDPAISSRYELVSHSQFLRVGASFDRVMYHFGNSIFHYEYFTLLKAFPGVVVLHDIYLGDCIFSNFEQLGTVELRQQIYASHGWNALHDCEGPIKQAIGLYPACGALFSDSFGVLVHSEFARETLSLYFADDVLSNVQVTALSRGIRELPDKQSARANLDICTQDRVYASFGLTNSKKCVDELLQAWATSDLAKYPAVKLYLVGGFSDPEIEERIREGIAALPLPAQVVTTGFVDMATYDGYLSATDIAVQLRRNSCGESSAALLDCMAAGLTTIINAHGSMAEMPDETVIKLQEEFSVEELADALSTSYNNFDALGGIGAVARSYIADHHSPRSVAAAYSRYMESCYHSEPKVLVNMLHSSLFAPRLRDLSPATLWNCIEDINDLMSSTGRVGSSMLAGSQLLVDISAVVQHDLKSGIQRVVRNILRELLQQRSLGYRVEAVYYHFETQQFRYARSFINQFLNLSPLYLSDDPVEARPGDIYLSLDLFYLIPGEEVSRRWLQFWRGRGVKIYHVLYDLMPIVLPHCFPADQVPLYNNWLKWITRISDGVVSISRSVADEYRAWLDQEQVVAVSRPNVGYFHLGAEMESHSATASTSTDEAQLPVEIQGQVYLLMVGTIEPRKGHAQVLDAFETLWSQGINLSLVVVGSVGWVDDRVAERLKTLAATSDTFHWLNFVSDSMLKALYEGAAGTIMASFGEGFGLPLIEAAYYGSSLLARDLPVFREVCGNHAWYFQSREGDGLALELRQWMELRSSGSLPNPAGIEWKNWSQSTSELLDSVLHDRWYCSPSLDAP